jgi:hypothetical protein
MPNGNLDLLRRDEVWGIEVRVHLNILKNKQNHIGGVMVSVLSSDALDHGFEPRLGQTKDYQIGSCCFSAKHAALKRKSKDWMARNQDNVSSGKKIIIKFVVVKCIH